MNQEHIQSLARNAQAILFSEGGSLTYKRLLQLLECTQEELQHVLAALRDMVNGSGLTLITSDTEASLAVADASRDAVKHAYERELGREIGDAGLEVLSILLYRGPSTRAKIDYIRGVNTSTTIRSLLQRGLVERTGNPDDAREYVYRPTVELLSHLGVSQKQDLPEYDKISAELAAFERSTAQESPFEENGTSEQTQESVQDTQ